MNERQEPDFEPVIPVTKGDLEYAVRSNRYQCAIVRAIQRQFPEAVRVRVDTEHISFGLADEDRRYDFVTPKQAIEKVIKPFDERGKDAVKPFSFKLTGGISRAVQHTDYEGRKAKRAAARVTAREENRQGIKREHNEGCAYYRFRALPEAEVQD